MHKRRGAGVGNISWKKVKGYERFHIRLFGFVCFNFILGWMCRITVIFGTLEDGSLLIGIFASNNCLSYRNIFQNGVDAMSKISDAFSTKS